uniref:HDC13468 n=1 Tax=Drosophila melanogaster TaxID=7227 RepID=Q6IK36_DROME|nr:TPA_inf: HDC13468 [Drosophila melanogaster]
MRNFALRHLFGRSFLRDFACSPIPGRLVPHMQRINSPVGHARRMECAIYRRISGILDARRAKYAKHATHAELMHFHLPGDQGYETGSEFLSSLPPQLAHSITGLRILMPWHSGVLTVALANVAMGPWPWAPNVATKIT